MTIQIQTPTWDNYFGICRQAVVWWMISRYDPRQWMHRRWWYHWVAYSWPLPPSHELTINSPVPVSEVEALAGEWERQADGDTMCSRDAPESSPYHCCVTALRVLA